MICAKFRLSAFAALFAVFGAVAGVAAAGAPAPIVVLPSNPTAVENWIRDVKSFGVRAFRETLNAGDIEGHFKSLRVDSR